jgi:hypothetical protein
MKQRKANTTQAQARKRKEARLGEWMGQNLICKYPLSI